MAAVRHEISCVYMYMYNYDTCLLHGVHVCACTCTCTKVYIYMYMYTVYTPSLFIVHSASGSDSLPPPPMPGQQYPPPGQRRIPGPPSTSAGMIGQGMYDYQLPLYSIHVASFPVLPRTRFTFTCDNCGPPPQLT